MRSADECIAKAAELSRLAVMAAAPDIRADHLRMAAIWLEVSCTAEWQDKFQFEGDSHDI